MQVREMEGEVGFLLSGGESHSRLLLIGRVIVDKEFDTDREGTYTSSERIDASIRDGLWWTHTRYVRASHFAFDSLRAHPFNVQRIRRKIKRNRHTKPPRKHTTRFVPPPLSPPFLPRLFTLRETSAEAVIL